MIEKMMVFGEKSNIPSRFFVANFAPKNVLLMKKEMYLMLLIATLVISSCSEKKQQAGQSQPVKVKTMPVGVSAAGGGQAYSGVIEEMSGTSLSFAGAGTVKTLNVSEGQFVAKGQVLGAIDPQTMQNTVNMARATTAQAEDALKQAEDAYGRMKLLHDNGSLPEIQWIDVQTKLSQAQQMVRQARASEQIARKGLTDTRLLAPFSGYVAQKLVDIGSNVVPGMPVIKLVKIDQVKVNISVPEEEISAISKGQTIHVTVAALGGKRFTARVIERGVSADPLSRSYEVKAVIANLSHELLPGMIAGVEGMASVAHKTRTCVSLPATIVQIDADNKPFVWIVQDGKAEKRMITVGENSGDNVMVTAGLSTGDKVIVEGQQKVSTGMQVTE